ncbi:MAG: hypothetical protein M1816_004059 [Peltula sp. TS41687]|nr:MAG: hypothetical protein M1816_004059 [Peltula sp. TS41687]
MDDEDVRERHPGKQDPAFGVAEYRVSRITGAPRGREELERDIFELGDLTYLYKAKQEAETLPTKKRKDADGKSKRLETFVEVSDAHLFQSDAAATCEEERRTWRRIREPEIPDSLESHETPHIEISLLALFERQDERNAEPSRSTVMTRDAMWRGRKIRDMIAEGSGIAEERAAKSENLRQRHNLTTKEINQRI